MIENFPVLLFKIILLPNQEVRLEINSEISKKVINASLLTFNSKLLVISPTNMFELLVLII